MTDPKRMEIGVEELLSESWAREKRKLIGSRALLPPRSEETRGGTVYLTTADAEGNMVSMIQCNYMGFGSGLVVPGTGIALHNRGHNFSFDPHHPNRLAPGKKPYHTIIPGFLTKDGRPLGPFGVMGAFMQPQGHVQVVMNLADFGHNPQAALDAPRFQWIKGNRVHLEKTLRPWPGALKQMGHETIITEETQVMAGVRSFCVWITPHLWEEPKAGLTVRCRVVGKDWHPQRRKVEICPLEMRSHHDLFGPGGHILSQTA